MKWISAAETDPACEESRNEYFSTTKRKSHKWFFFQKKESFFYRKKGVETPMLRDRSAKSSRWQSRSGPVACQYSTVSLEVGVEGLGEVDQRCGDRPRLQKGGW